MPIVDRRDECRMSGRMFRTLDGIEYSYDICNHVLLRDRSGGLFSITGDLEMTPRAL